jgi:hypothetical protein
MNQELRLKPNQSSLEYRKTSLVVIVLEPHEIKRESRAN